MLFEASRPVVGSEFADREAEIKKLLAAAEALKKGATRYLAILGPRKMGKTSLLRELVRRAESRELACMFADCWDKKPTPAVFFREYVAQAVDGFVRAARPRGVTRSLKAGLASPAETTLCLAELRGLGLRSIDRASELLLRIGSEELSDAVFEAAANVPEDLAQEAGIHMFTIIDEFQELAVVNGCKVVKENLGDIFAFFRARWQSHQRVNYILSGSRTTAMREILTRERAPLFQHFEIMELAAFDEAHALDLLHTRSEDEGQSIPAEIASRVVKTVGTCPFYLQIVGAELCALDTIDEDGFKTVLQRLLFEESGRLYLYFRDLVGRVVGRSASIERTLLAMAQQPGRLSDLARRLGTAPGTLKSWINRCSDLVAVDEGVYRIGDPCLALWLQTKSDDRAVLPTVVLGNEAEQFVARRMAAAGFESVFQSRANRGAFDLLAVQGATEVGVQVKKGALPFYVPADEIRRMQHWAKRLGWVPILALVDEDDALFYNVARLRPSARRCRFDERTRRVQNLLELAR